MKGASDKLEYPVDGIPRFQSVKRALIAAQLGCLALGLTLGCAKKEIASSTVAAAAHHEHSAPHGGTPVVLGDEAYHLELVRDAANGKLQAFLLDGEMENFVRCVMPSFEVTASVGGEQRSLIFQAIADSATGEKIGDTALFEATADWLKTTEQFDGTVRSLTVRGTVFESVKFNFPRGNEPD